MKMEDGWYLLGLQMINLSNRNICWRQSIIKHCSKELSGRFDHVLTHMFIPIYKKINKNNLFLRKLRYQLPVSCKYWHCLFSYIHKKNRYHLISEHISCFIYLCRSLQYFPLFFYSKIPKPGCFQNPILLS